MQLAVICFDKCAFAHASVNSHRSAHFPESKRIVPNRHWISGLIITEAGQMPRAKPRRIVRYCMRPVASNQQFPISDSLRAHIGTYWDFLINRRRPGCSISTCHCHQLRIDAFYAKSPLPGTVRLPALGKCIVESADIGNQHIFLCQPTGGNQGERACRTLHVFQQYARLGPCFAVFTDSIKDALPDFSLTLLSI